MQCYLSEQKSHTTEVGLTNGVQCLLNRTSHKESGSSLNLWPAPQAPSETLVLTSPSAPRAAALSVSLLPRSTHFQLESGQLFCLRAK